MDSGIAQILLASLSLTGDKSPFIDLGFLANKRRKLVRTPVYVSCRGQRGGSARMASGTELPFDSSLA
jgi:hypothetical protein